MDKFNQVAIYHGAGIYPDGPLYSPVKRYPEYPFSNSLEGEQNSAYEGIRESLRLLGLDSTRFGQIGWNPLGEIIQTGDHVLLKPNLIRESHSFRYEEWKQVITHPSIIRAVLDYVYIALQGAGRVTIADGPQTDSDFDEIKRRTALDEIVTFFREKGLAIELIDLRRDRWLQKDGVTSKRESLPGDPMGYTNIRLDQDSEFENKSPTAKFYGADYDISETAKFHGAGHHEYILCRTVMDADVVINIPKMKTHKKTGVTLSLKNMVGINGYRNCLPHHTLGTPEDGGDEFPENKLSNHIQSKAIQVFKKSLVALGGCGGPFARMILTVGKATFGDTNKVIRSGNWYGNDTTWRMVLDLNKALFHFSGDGSRRTRPLRYLTIIDGIVAGEGDGPVVVDAKPAGLIVAGFDPVATDNVCATVMGFDCRKIPMLVNAWSVRGPQITRSHLDKLRVRSNVDEWNGTFQSLEGCHHDNFRPHFGWIGHIEREANL